MPLFEPPFHLAAFTDKHLAGTLPQRMLAKSAVLAGQ